MQGRILIAADDPMLCRAIESVLPEGWTYDLADRFASAAALPELDSYALLLLAVRPKDIDVQSLFSTLTRRRDVQTLTAGPFVYNTATLRLYKNGREIYLTGRENAMMKLFLDHPDRVFTRDMLYELLWGSADIDENAAAVYVSRLRRKIEDDPHEPRYLQTVRGIGYRFTV